MKKSLYRIPFLFLPLCFAGCASTEAGKSAVEVGLLGTGGILGYQLSDGRPVATAAGAVAGYMVSKAVQSHHDRALQEAEKNGYERALNQAVKQQYWILQNQQKSLSPEADRDPRLVPVVIPETKINGVTINAHVAFLRLEP